MGFVHLSATDAMNHLPGARVSSAIAEKNSEVIHAIAHFWGECNFWDSGIFLGVIMGSWYLEGSFLDCWITRSSPPGDQICWLFAEEGVWAIPSCEGPLANHKTWVKFQSRCAPEDGCWNRQLLQYFADVSSAACAAHLVDSKANIQNNHRSWWIHTHTQTNTHTHKHTHTQTHTHTHKNKHTHTRWRLNQIYWLVVSTRLKN